MYLSSMTVWAQTSAGQAQAGGGLMAFLPMIIIFAVFWVILIMPQRKQQKQRQAMLDALKKGDRVITVGGIHGEITEINDEDLKLRVSDKIELKFARSAVSRVKGD